jgi:hypothetical protein
MLRLKTPTFSQERGSLSHIFLYRYNVLYGTDYSTVLCSIADPDSVPFWPLDTSWVKNQDPDPGWTSLIIQYFRALRNNFLVWKYQYWKNSFMRNRIRDAESFWLWIRDGKIRIRDKHPGSATLAPVLFKRCSCMNWFKQKMYLGSASFIFLLTAMIHVV